MVRVRSSGGVWSAVAGLAFVTMACDVPTSPAAPTSPSAAQRSTDVELGAPEDVVFAADGTMYVSEFLGNRIDVVDGDQHMTVWAGTGSPGYGGDGGAALAADLSAPTGLVLSADGMLVFADHDNGCIRTVSVAGVIDRLSGRCDAAGFSGDGGPALDAQMDDPIGIAFDGQGRLWIADEQNGRIRRVNGDGSIETVAGGGSVEVSKAGPNSVGTELELGNPSYVVVDDDDNVYFSDFTKNVVMRIDPDGRVTRVAGTGRPGSKGDGGAAVNARLNFPTGLALDEDGNLYVSDAENHRIRMVDVEGTITTVAGTGTAGYSGDGGPAVEAQLQAPAGLAFDPFGRLVIADQGNNLVRMVDAAGVITTIAGVAP